MGTSYKVINPTDKHIIFFDGYCNLCNGAVNYIIDRDSNRYFLFSSLQSSQAQELIGSYLSETGIDSIIVLSKQSDILNKSDAAIFIAKHLGGWSKLLLIFKIFPRIIRNWFYEIIAKYRYSIFGKEEVCRIPTPDLKGRFLDSYQNS